MFILVTSLFLISASFCAATFYYKNLSEKDIFTGCYNKDWAVGRRNSKLVRMMKKTRRTRKEFGLLFIDMDNFKEVNDSRGHVFGDNIIKMTVSAIRDCLLDKDILVRFGGDEVMVLVACTNASALSETAENIRDNIEHKTLRTVSIGGALFLEDSEVSVETLVNQADRKVYKAKENGRNCVVI